MVVAVLALTTWIAAAAPHSCEGSGEARIDRRKLEEVRQEARKLALADCLDTLATKLLKGTGPSELEARRLTAAFVALGAADPGRLIHSTKVIREEVSRGTLRLKIRSGVVILSARAVLEEARDRLRTLHWPILGVATDELYFVGDGRTKVGQRRDFGRALSAALAHQGYDIAELSFDPGTSFDLLEDVAALAHLGREKGAELMIVGEVDVRAAQRPSVHDASVEASIDVALRVIDVARREVTGKRKLSARSDGSTLERALVRAIDAGLVDQAITGLRVHLVKEAGQAAPLRKLKLRFDEVGRYRLRGRAVFETLKLIQGVTEAEVLDTDDVMLEVELSYTGSDERLGAAILDEARKSRQLTGLGFVDAGPDLLRFRFDRPPSP